MTMLGTLHKSRMRERNLLHFDHVFRLGQNMLRHFEFRMVELTMNVNYVITIYLAVNDRFMRYFNSLGNRKLGAQLFCVES